MQDMTNRIEALKGHPFVDYLESLVEVPASSMTLHYPNRNREFPSFEFEFNVPPETVETCERIFGVHHRIANILRTLENLQRTLSVVTKIDFSKDVVHAARDFEYYVENYYLRVPFTLA